MYGPFFFSKISTTSRKETRPQMNPELLEHLDKARDTVNQVDLIVSSHRYPNDIRTVMIMGLLSTIIQHHRGCWN